MSIVQAIIFSIVEGITEFLPISSTGHLILTASILTIVQSDFVKSFEIIIQLGAILAVVFLYWKDIAKNRKAWKPIILAFLPTAIVGFTLYKFVKSVLLGNAFVTVLMLFLGGIVLIAIEYLYKDKNSKISKIENITTKDAIIIGLAQSVSIVPGVSRAAATIIGAMVLGVKRKTAVEFSFLLAIPTMAAATGLDLIKTSFSYGSAEWTVLIVGFVGSFVVALFAVKFFLKFVETHTFIPFGIYRIVLSLLFLLFMLK